MEMQNLCQPLRKMGKMAVVPQKRVLEQNFQLPTPLKFGSPHESVLEQRFSFYPTSHLCVVLHFLIFFQQSANAKWGSHKSVRKWGNHMCLLTNQNLRISWAIHIQNKMTKTRLLNCRRLSPWILNMLSVTDRIQNMGEGYVFTGVCHSVHNWEAASSQHPSLVTWPEEGSAF